ncbi:MAG: hypothetical protein IIA44_07345 [Acidobacteria bacterium]|nr:hypothetical protein [Acidobacteriota bacterium]
MKLVTSPSPVLASVPDSGQRRPSASFGSSGLSASAGSSDGALTTIVLMCSEPSVSVTSAVKPAPKMGSWSSKQSCSLRLGRVVLVVRDLEDAGVQPR